MFTKITDAHVKVFASVVGEEFTATAKEILEANSKDYTEDLRFIPEVVLRPSNAQEVSAILKICNAEKSTTTRIHFAVCGYYSDSKSAFSALGQRVQGRVNFQAMRR